MLTESYVGHRVFIHDENGQEAGATTVLEHNWEDMTIIVRGVLRDVDNHPLVTVLIIMDNGVHEYSGKPRRSTMDSTSIQISLFRGKVRENRAAHRYPVDAAGMVENLVIDSKRYPLLHGISVLVCNLSTTGVLIRAVPNAFRVDCVFELKLPVSDGTIMISKVVRMRPVDSSATDYGCKFLFVESGEGNHR